MKERLKRPCVLILIITFLITKQSHAQIDSIAKALADTVISKLIVNDIPKKTFKDKLMYPHRWYVKQLLRPKVTDFDTSYITNSNRKLTITIPASKKFYGYNINDIKTNKHLQFSPNNYYHVGIHFSNLILTFGFVPGTKFGARPGRGSTKSTDFQLTIIGRRVITDVNYQNYKGFYIHNFEDFHSDLIIRPDISAVSFGVNTMFVYNYKKYSLRGAFSFTDVQRKSAGSFMTGIYHSHILFSSRDSTFVNSLLKNYFSPLLNEVNKISQITIGVSGGYGYTYVYKKFIFCTVANVGVGGQRINYTTIDNIGHTLSVNLAFNFNAKAALRFDNLRFFSGVMATYDNNFAYNSNLFNTESYIAKVVVFVGYRFNLKRNGKKVLKKMGLIEYKK